MDRRAEVSWRRSLMEYLKFCLEYCKKHICQVTWVVTFLTSCLPFIGFFSLLVFLLGGFLAVPLVLFVFTMAFLTEVQDLAPQVIRPLLGFLNYLFLSIVCKIPRFKYTGYITDEQNKDVIEQVLDDQNRENVNENYGQIFEDWNCSERDSEEVERLNFNVGDSEEVERLNFNGGSEEEEEVELEPLDSSSSSVCSTSPFSSKLSYNQVANNEAGSQQFEYCNSLRIIPSKNNINMKMDGWVCKESMSLRKNYYRELQALKHTPLSEYRRYEAEDDEWQPTQFYELLEFWRKKEKNWT